MSKQLWSDEQIRGRLGHVMTSEYDFLAVVHVRDDYEAELARLRSGFDAADEIMRRAVEESARLRIENDRLMAILDAIDEHAPLADETTVRPGVTLSQAARNMLRDEFHPLFVDAPAQVQEASE